MRFTKKTCFLILFFLGALNTFAQDTKTTEKNISEEIEIIRPYKPILAEAVKLRRSPDLDAIKTYKSNLKYNISTQKLTRNADIQKLQAQSVATEKTDTLYNNYVKAGLGNLSTLLGEIYINNGADEALQVGTYFKHFSQAGSLNSQKENTQHFSAFGKSIGNRLVLDGLVNYHRHGLYFYGTDRSQPHLNANPTAQTFNFIALEGEMVSKYKDDAHFSDYALKASAYLLNDKYNAREKTLTLSGYVNQRISSFNIGLAASVDFGDTKDQQTSVGNNLLRLNPYFKIQTNGIKINAGINFAQEFGTFSSSRLFPSITADFTLIPNFLQIFGEIKGDINRSSLKSFTDENPFLNSNILIKNAAEKLSVSAGIKGTGGAGFGYKAKLYIKQIENMPLFVSNFNSFNKFDVIYDTGNMKLTGLEGEISIQISNRLKWTGKLNLEDYAPATEKRSFYKPQARLSSNLMLAVNSQLTFNARLYGQDGMYAKTFTADTQNPSIGVEKIVNISGFIDVGAGADYKIGKRVSIFAQVNNLLNSNYYRYLYYQSFGLNVYGGATFSF